MPYYRSKYRSVKRIGMSARKAYLPRRFVRRFPRRGVQRPVTAKLADSKYFDVAGATYGCNTTGSITHLDIVPQGTTVTTREGKSFRLTSVWARGSIDTLATTVLTDVLCMLVWDRQPNKALAAITDVIDVVTADSFTKRENAGRFKILKKWSMSMVGVSSGSGGGGISNHRVDDYVKMPPDCVAVCTNADTTGAIGNRISGALLLVTAGDQVAAGTVSANLISGFRIGFKEA